MVNRAAIILRYKEPAIRWINEADPYDRDFDITSESANEERTIYLISDDDGDTPQTVERWIKGNYPTVFEEELEGWYTEPALWPENRTLKMFKEWFEV